MFGMNPEQTAQAGTVCELLGQHWREFIVGRQGFLLSLPPTKTKSDTGDWSTRLWERGSRAGLYRRGVEWGEMDCMVCLFAFTFEKSNVLYLLLFTKLFVPIVLVLEAYLSPYPPPEET